MFKQQQFSSDTFTRKMILKKNCLKKPLRKAKFIAALQKWSWTIFKSMRTSSWMRGSSIRNTWLASISLLMALKRKIRMNYSIMMSLIGRLKTLLSIIKMKALI